MRGAWLAAALMGVVCVIGSVQGQWIAPSVEAKALPLPSWVWAEGEKAEPGPARAFLSREFVVLEGAKEAELFAGADNRATVFVNGREVLKVSGWSSVARARVILAAGPNVITVAAENRDPAGREVAPAGGTNPAGFICALTGPGLEVVTDASWNATAEAWNGFPAAAPAASKGARVLGSVSAAPWGLKADAFAAAGACPMLRRAFIVHGAPVKATVRVIGLGQYQLHCNGMVVGDTILNQAWSQYDKRLFWQEFDVLGLVQPGDNVLGVMLADSFWRVGQANDSRRFTKTDAMPDFSNGRPHLLWVEARLTFANGQEQVITSDGEWKWSPGPVTFSNVYAGEDYDAMREQAGWDRSGFDAAAWKKVEVVAAPNAELSELKLPGIKAFEIFDAVEVREPAAGVYTYVFPQNCSAVLRLRVKGPRGATVRMRPCEYMDAAGRVKFTYTWGTGKDIWQDYTLRGGETEEYQSPFFYVGCQYVEVSGAVPEGRPNPNGLPVIEELRLVHTREACERVGEFTCSDPIQNAARRLIDWSMRSNMSHVPTDCPHREKNGWQEQNWHMARALSYRYDTAAWMSKVCQDIRDAQGEDGFIPTNCPWYLVGRPRHDMFNDSTEWGIAGVLVPWHLYEWYGDHETLRASYASMKRFVEYLGTTAKDGLITSNLGDWYDYGHGKGDGPSQWTPNTVSATAVWALGAKTVADAAVVLGEDSDASEYRAMYGRIRGRFIAAFWDPVKKQVKNGGSCQAANSTAWCAGLLPEADREAALDEVVKDLEARGWQQTPGEVLQVFFIRAMAESGRGDVLHRVYSRMERGSYGFMVQSGLTSLPESWDSKPGTGNSMNHFMLGHLMEWQYAYVAGIRQAPGSVGWKRVLIAPQPGPTMREAQALFMSPAGKIESRWKRDGSSFELEVDVPVEAIVVMPDGSRHELKAGQSTHRCELK